MNIQIDASLSEKHDEEKPLKKTYTMFSLDMKEMELSLK
jgi:hypothetical protein